MTARNGRNRERSPVDAGTVAYALEMFKVTLDERYAREHETRVRVGRLERMLGEMLGMPVEQADEQRCRRERGKRMRRRSK